MTTRYCFLLIQVINCFINVNVLSLRTVPHSSQLFDELSDLNLESASHNSHSNQEGWSRHVINDASESYDKVDQLEPRRFFVTSGNSNNKINDNVKKSGQTGSSQSLFESEEQRDVSPAAQVNERMVLQTSTIDEVFCDFGPLPVQSLCEWQDGCGAVKWVAGTGLATNWLGGPPNDSTAGTMEGGFGFIETSQLHGKSSLLKSSDFISPNGLLHSPQLGSTGVSGTCFMFKFAMDGLSSAGLRILLHMGYDEFSSTALKNNNDTSRPITKSCSRPFESAKFVKEERILWNAHYNFPGTWQQAQILYTFPDYHSLIIEGMAVESTDPSRSYRGYIAIDDIDLQPGTSCVGFCNFAGGICDWTNDQDDDFDWSNSRGSSRATTGPVMDRDSATATLASNNGGGYAYIDSGYPRRPGDMARLSSVGFPASAPDSPMCMHFSFHMFGSGVGELKVSLRHIRNLEPQIQEIWRLKGNAGNAWFDARVTVSSLDDFQILFEASVGNTAMGDIAIDDISFSTGACPISPQVAAPSNFPRDCGFEIDECEWLNSREPSGGPSISIGGPGGLPHIPIRSRVDWERVSLQTLSSRNQRKAYSLYTMRPRQEYFMALQSRGTSPAVSGTAYLSSNLIKGTNDPLCLTFWFLMFESFIDATGPSLGVLRVLVQPAGENVEAALPIWQLYNNQGPSWNYGQASIVEKRDFNILFEGTWGPNRANGNIAIDDIAFYMGNCSVRPNSAIVRLEDCSFEKGLCGWENVTNNGVNDPRLQWQRALPNHRPAQLLDKTFGSSGDFVFFDIFSPTQKRQVRLRSPQVNIMPEDEAHCFTFWFVAFGVEESTSLKILRISAEDNGSPEDSQEENGKQQTLWSLTAKGFNNPRPSWTWAQVTIETRAPYRLILEGSASNGGFAIDDIKFQPQACPTRPLMAKPSATFQELQ